MNNSIATDCMLRPAQRTCLANTVECITCGWNYTEYKWRRTQLKYFGLKRSALTGLWRLQLPSSNLNMENNTKEY